MPTYYSKDGLRIEMRTKEHGHGIPHVHAVYAGKSMSFDLSAEALIGDIDRRKKDEARAWIKAHTAFLMAKWKEMHENV